MIYQSLVYVNNKDIYLVGDDDSTDDTLKIQIEDHFTTHRIHYIKKTVDLKLLDQRQSGFYNLTEFRVI